MALHQCEGLTLLFHVFGELEVTDYLLGSGEVRFGVALVVFVFQVSIFPCRKYEV